MLARIGSTLYGLVMLAALSTQAAGAPKWSQSLIFGIGRESCAEWQSTQITERDGENWILGYWSGVNTANPQNPFVGKSPDGAGIIGATKLLRQKEPSATLQDATVRIYNRFVNERK